MKQKYTEISSRSPSFIKAAPANSKHSHTEMHNELL